MSPEELQHFAQRFDAMFNTPDIDIADVILAPNFRTDQPLGLEFKDLPSFKAYVQSLYVAFPDLRQEIYDSFLMGDKAVLRVGYFGTHKGEFLGVPATGRSITMPGIGIFRFEGGKAVENWAQYDLFAVYQRLTAPAI
jgi:predicted ester cyclase